MFEGLHSWWSRKKLERLFDRQMANLQGGDFPNNWRNYLPEIFFTYERQDKPNYNPETDAFRRRLVRVDSDICVGTDIHRSDYKKSTEQFILRKFNPDPLVERFEDMRDDIVAHAMNLDMDPGALPFLPVIPRSVRGLRIQISMLSTEYGPGEADAALVMKNYVGYASTRDIVDVPESPYFVFNVSDGSEYRGVTKSATEACLNVTPRRALTTEELIAFGLHTDEWQGRVKVPYIRALSSRQRDSKDKVPFLSIASNKPYVGAWTEQVLFEGDPTMPWETPSCSSNILRVR